MGTSDGYLGALAKVVDHGAASSRWNLVILGDGYQASELSQYHGDVQKFIDELYATPPYDELWCGINIYRIDVVSTDSGADDPASCPDGAGSGATAKTYFDATFCSTGPGGQKLSRLLTIDSSSAKSIASSRVPEVHQVLVIVNSSKYGGSGGDVAVCSTNSASAKIAIHEIGHSEYGLADEYEGDGSATPAGEPPEPNVTRDTNRATNKWRDLIDPATPMPSSCYADCTTCTGPATPPPAGAVGTYEGGNYAHCGVFRPLTTCYMRDYSPFCPVCARVIRNTLAPFLPTESLALITPTVTFADIPEGIGGTGVTTYRAVTFEVVSCRRLHFAMTAGPTGGFGTPLGTSVEAKPAEIGPLERVHLWLSYTSTTAGATANGSVTVQCQETGQSWVIPVFANTVARPKSAVALVLDHSGSMAEDAGDAIPKATKLREAAAVFVDAMLPGDGIGLVRFDDTAERLMDVTDVGALTTGAGRVAAIGHISSNELDPDGMTSIGQGIEQGKLALDDAQAAATPTYDVTAMVVLTDGVENTAPMIADVSSSISANTFAIGLGLPSNISVAALDALTQGHAGYLVVTGELTTDQRFYLTKYFLQILAGITNANVIVDPTGDLPFGAEQRIPFAVTEADYGLDVFLLTPFPQVVDFQLECPNGTRITPAAAPGLGTTDFVLRSGASFYRASLPAIPGQGGGSHAGIWHAVLRYGRGAGWSTQYDLDAVRRVSRSSGQGLLPYDVLAHCYSCLNFSAWAVQGTYAPSAQVDVYARLREYDVPVERRARVWAEIACPDGSQLVVGLQEQREGRFSGSFRTSVPGLYRGRIRARGETLYGSLFTREQAITVVAIPGGDWPRHPLPPDTIGDLLCCWLKSGARGGHSLGSVLDKNAQESLLGCLRRVCESRPRAYERPRVARYAQRSTDPKDEA